MLHFGVPSKGLKRRVESPPFFGVSSGIPKKIGDFESVEWIVQLLSSLWDDLKPEEILECLFAVDPSTFIWGVHASPRLPRLPS